MPQFYELQLIVLTSFCALTLLIDRHVTRRKSVKLSMVVDHCLEQGVPAANGESKSLETLTRQYLVVYGIVMGADWLQGPYVYSLYREQYGFSERIVAILFVTGFMSAGLAAPFVGIYADQHGRKRTCLLFCITYMFSCACILFPWLPILLFGRILSGISTSILFSAFESWLVSASTCFMLPQSDISVIMGRATLLNGFVATGAGVVSNGIVSISSSFASPFIASGALLMLAWGLMRVSWIENYGHGGSTTDDDWDIFQTSRLRAAWNIVQHDSLLLTLGLTQTCFEGSMYLFVFLWVPSLQEVSMSSELLPLGYIFSSFMISMMLGSLLYTAIVSHSPPPSTVAGSIDSPLTIHAKLSSMVSAVSALALAVSISFQDEKICFWAFCAFEACVGMYYPVQGTLRGFLITNEHRATLSALFRIPLNMFVVVSLLTGVSSVRYAVLTASALMLAFSSIMTGAIIVKRSDGGNQRPA
ncbi:DUF791-domain-containing protein [Guyanagaster necrorhizus]|uniref:Molybdate-anion transporter n=1 Tax=Guyanagaster necrorhizus TaxID=856835 RepID=A0A9P8AUJ8_9AGAR|nr:DUF791-domain-containing protein [Guyanagaster necrorhizus MCA 3950]KAG7448548.1 DUF791-domain-containing protein [Guyanagaster necrorhizus MCA 3950]